MVYIINVSFNKPLFDQGVRSEPYFKAGLGPIEVTSVNVNFDQRQSACQRIKTLTGVLTSKFDYETCRYFSPGKLLETSRNIYQVQCQPRSRGYYLNFNAFSREKTGTEAI
jgi:hypothetical protein